MLFYVRCPSCARVLSFDLDKYYEDLNAIKNNPKLDKNQKASESSKLIDKYGYKMECCRMRILTQLEFHKIISS